MGTIVVPYRPRDAFRPYHDSDKRFSVTVAHRRAGKTVARINKLIRKAVECEKQDPRFGYLAPYYVQAKDIAWLYLKRYAAPLIELGGKVNETELSVTLPHNKAVIRLYGADNAERLRGLYFDGLAVDEAQGIAKPVLTSIIMPALSDRLGWLDCSGTPRGWTNLLGELVKLAKSQPDDWFLQILRASDTGIISPQELANQRKLMPDNEYDQEFECSFDAAITGSYYGKELHECDKDGRITTVAIDPSLPVHTAWDLGYKDDTAIWWYQVTRGEVHIVDFHASSGMDVPYYSQLILSKGYNYGTHWLPHDARAKTLASGGRSIIEQLAAELGLKNLKIAPELSVQDGIQAVRMMLPRTWFDADFCEQGVEALRQYQREWDEDKRVFREKPRHDWTSHPADAFRMLALAWREEHKPEPVKEAIRGITVGQNTVTLNEMWSSVAKTSDRI